MSSAKPGSPTVATHESSKTSEDVPKKAFAKEKSSTKGASDQQEEVKELSSESTFTSMKTISSEKVHIDEPVRGTGTTPETLDKKPEAMKLLKEEKSLKLESGKSEPVRAVSRKIESVNSITRERKDIKLTTEVGRPLKLEPIKPEPTKPTQTVEPKLESEVTVDSKKIPESLPKQVKRVTDDVIQLVPTKKVAVEPESTEFQPSPDKKIINSESTLEPVEEKEKVEISKKKEQEEQNMKEEDKEKDIKEEQENRNKNDDEEKMEKEKKEEEKKEEKKEEKEEEEKKEEKKEEEKKEEEEDSSENDDEDEQSIPSGVKIGSSEDEIAGDLPLGFSPELDADMNPDIQLRISVFSAATTTATVTVESSDAANVWCTGVPRGSSVDWDRVMKNTKPVYVNRLTAIRVTGLKPDLSYDIYCSSKTSRPVNTYIHTTKRKCSQLESLIATVTIRRLKFNRQHLSFTLFSDIPATASCKIFNNSS